MLKMSEKRREERIPLKNKNKNALKKKEEMRKIIRVENDENGSLKSRSALRTFLFSLNSTFLSSRNQPNKIVGMPNKIINTIFWSNRFCPVAYRS